VQNSFYMTPASPTIWDASYTEPIVGTFLGTGSTTLGNIALLLGGGAESTTVWSDFNTVVTLPGSFSTVVGCGGTWSAITANTFNTVGVTLIYNTEYDLAANACTSTTYTTVTVTGILSFDAAHYSAALPVIIIPLFAVSLFAMFGYMANMRGDNMISLILTGLFIGDLLGMLTPQAASNGVVPMAMTIFSGIGLFLWLYMGGNLGSNSSFGNGVEG
jgi:hypothetical protein